MAKIYDCFLFSNEIELLHLRLKLLSQYVDQFVLLESPWSFHGKPKEMLFDKYKNEFDTSKIRHIVYEDLPHIGDVNGKRSRGKRNERFARDCSLRGLTDAEPNDIIMLSDVDELPNMKVVLDNLYLLEDENSHLLRNKNYPYLGLHMPMFYYYVDCLAITRKPCVTTLVSKFKNFKKPSKMRKIRGENYISDSGWHYSYLGGIRRIQEKLNIIGSVEKCIDKWRSEEHLAKCLAEGKDLFNRSNIKFKMVNPIEYGPKELSDFLERYSYLQKGVK